MGSFYASSNAQKEAMQKVYLMNPTPYALNAGNKDFRKTSLLGETNSLPISYNYVLGSNQPSLLHSNDLNEASHSSSNSEQYSVPPFPCQALSLSISSQQQSMVSLSSAQLQLVQANLIKSPSFIHVSEDEKRIYAGSRDFSRNETTFETKLKTYERKKVSEVVDSFIACSKYLKVAQELMEEVVKPREDIKRPNKLKSEWDIGVSNVGCTSMRIMNYGLDSSNSTSKDGMQYTIPTAVALVAADYQKSCLNATMELTSCQRQELEMKKLKLTAMLNEVNRRYKRYYTQMEGVVKSFESIAGVGAAKIYTATSVQAISRQFRSLRDTIAGQIGATSRALGEPYSEAIKGLGREENARARAASMDICEEKFGHPNFGLIMQAQPYSWRPQRGLPEHAVSVLRAWLFEHFLHPYPKDVDKIMLAKQSGLTRNQVSNWFINARVRLWKPMVEEMYIEEIREEEVNYTKKCCDTSVEGINLVSKASTGMEEVENERWSGRKRWADGFQEGIISHIELNDNNYNVEEDDMVMMMMMKKAKHKENIDGSRSSTLAISVNEDPQHVKPIELVLEDDDPNYGPFSSHHLQSFPSPIYNNNNITNVSLTLGLKNCNELSLFGASNQRLFQANDIIRPSLSQMD